jgi:hypothetical protein
MGLVNPYPSSPEIGQRRSSHSDAIDGTAHIRVEAASRVDVASRCVSPSQSI